MRDTRRQLHLNAYDALRYGLVDQIEGLPLLPQRMVRRSEGILSGSESDSRPVVLKRH
jgi:hypothetical protein